MTTNTNDPWKNNGQNTSAGSTNQGIQEAQSGNPASPQQAGESSVSYQTRMTAFNSSKD